MPVLGTLDVLNYRSHEARFYAESDRVVYVQPNLRCTGDIYTRWYKKKNPLYIRTIYFIAHTEYCYKDVTFLCKSTAKIPTDADARFPICIHSAVK